MKQKSIYLYVVVGREFALTVNSVKWSKYYNESDLRWKMKCEGEESEISEGTGKSSFSYVFKEKYANKTVAFTAYLKDESLQQFSSMVRAIYPGKIIKVHVLPKLENYYVRDIVNESPRDGKYYSGNVVKLRVSEYYKVSVDKVPKKVKQSIQWFVNIHGEMQILTVRDTIFAGDTIEFNIPSEWSGKKVMIMPCITSPTPVVSVTIDVAGFPIVIDRYKMPGLDETGTDIADDMAYGYGFKSGRPIYNTLLITRFKKSYERKHENNEVDPVLSNSADYDPAPPVFQASPLDAKQKMERYVRIKNAKAIYSEDGIPETVYGIKKYIRGCLIPIQTIATTIADLFKSDEQKLRELKIRLFAEFRGMVRLFFTSSDNPDMRENILAMIDKFERNEGGVYESKLLTKNIEKHPSTVRYCKGGKKDGIETYIRKQLEKNKGDVSKLLDETVYFVTETSMEKRKEQEKEFSVTPLYPADIPFIGEKEKVKNATDGYTIALNDIWATEVAITDYTLDGKDYKVTYRVTLWDHFGLDLPDIQPDKPAGYLDGFRAWFVLQHFLGYKPFITKITFTKEFKGSL